MKKLLLFMFVLMSCNLYADIYETYQTTVTANRFHTGLLKGVTIHASSLFIFPDGTTATSTSTFGIGNIQVELDLVELDTGTLKTSITNLEVSTGTLKNSTTNYLDKSGGTMTGTLGTSSITVSGQITLKDGTIITSTTTFGVNDAKYMQNPSTANLNMGNFAINNAGNITSSGYVDVSNITYSGDTKIGFNQKDIYDMLSLKISNGSNSNTIGAGSLTVGSNGNTVSGNGSFGTGSNILVSGNNAAGIGGDGGTQALKQGSISMGNNGVITNSIYGITIGMGDVGGSGQSLTNNRNYSLMMGMYTSTPTFYLAPAGGSDNFGMVGINTIEPTSTMTVRGTGEFTDLLKAPTFYATGGYKFADGTIISSNPYLNLGGGSSIDSDCRISSGNAQRQLDALDSEVAIDTNTLETNKLDKSSATATYLPLNGKAADANLLDGLDSTAFVDLTTNQTITTGNKTFKYVVMDGSMTANGEVFTSSQIVSGALTVGTTYYNGNIPLLVFTDNTSGVGGFEIYGSTKARARMHFANSLTGNGNTDGTIIGLTDWNNSWIDDTFFIGNKENGSILFQTNGVNQMELDESGNLSVGKTNPAQALDVDGNGLFNGYVDVSAGITNSGGTTISMNNKIITATVITTTKTITLTAGNGDLFTSSGSHAGISEWVNTYDTFTVTGVQGYCLGTSTFTTFLNVDLSAGIGSPLKYIASTTTLSSELYVSSSAQQGNFLTTSLGFTTIKPNESISLQAIRVNNNTQGGTFPARVFITVYGYITRQY